MTLKKEIHKPFIYENKDSKTIVIFIHGILEGPNQFKEFAEILHKEGFSYSAILLHGHGKSGKYFAKSSREKWMNSVDKEILKHKDNYENIILVGHSMGALLSLLFALKYKNKVKGIVLISTPLKVFVRFNMIISSIKVAFGRVREQDTLAKYAKKAFSVERGSIFTYISWIPRYVDLFTLISLTKKELKNIEVPTLIVQCKRDELVSYKTLKVFKRKLQNDYEVINLEKSGHFYYDDEELRYLLNEFEIFINKV